MLAAVLALGASVSWGIADFLGGLKSRRLHVLTVMAIAQPVGLTAMTIAVLAIGDGPSGGDVVWAAPAALLGTVGIAAFYRGMAVGSMSIVAPVAATGALIPVVVGIAAGDRPSAVQLLGFPLAIGGAVLASREPAGALGGGRVAAGVPWAILAAAGFGAYFVPMHAAGEEDFVWAAFLFRFTATILVLLAVAAVRPPFRADRRDLAAIAVIGILDTAATLLFAAAASQGIVSVTSVLASLYPVVTVALAWIYLSERVHAAQAVGVAAALGGVVLISAG